MLMRGKARLLELRTASCTGPSAATAKAMAITGAGDRDPVGRRSRSNGTSDRRAPDYAGRAGVQKMRAGLLAAEADRHVRIGGINFKLVRVEVIAEPGAAVGVFGMGVNQRWVSALISATRY